MPAVLIKRVKPAFRWTQTSLHIADVQDAIFFTETRAVRVRLHLKTEGRSLEEAWLAQLKRYFDFLDRDGDGVLNSYEAEFVFSNRGMQ